jgi:hypothetical protein
MMQKSHPEEGLIHIGPARNVNLNGKSMSQQPSPIAFRHSPHHSALSGSSATALGISGDERDVING